MIHRLIPTAFLFVTLGTYALAQTPNLQPDPVAMTPEQLTEAVVAIQTQLKALLAKESPDTTSTAPGYGGGTTSDLQVQLDQVKADVEQLKIGVGGNTSNLAAVIEQQRTMADTLKEVSDGLSQMTKDQLELASQIKEISTRLDQIGVKQDEFQNEISDEVSEITTQLGQISRSVGGSTTLRFDNIQDDTTRQQFQDLVNKTTPTTGTIAVKNKMTSGQYIFINRVQHYIPAGTEEKITVPTGNVSTQLPGQKVVNWSISAPNYRQGIQIVPDQIPVQTTTTTVSLRPPVVYEPVPVYSDPFSYITVR